MLKSTILFQILCLLFVWTNFVCTLKYDGDLDEVVGGTTVLKGAHKYKALILKTKGTETTLCGGTVISENHILTSASCVDAKPYDKLQVIVRVYTIVPMDSTRIIRYVLDTDIQIHKDYNKLTRVNDIAILRMSSPLDLTLIAKVTLPPEAASSPSYAGTTGIATGWGITLSNGTSVARSMQQVSLQIRDKLACEALHDNYDDKLQLCTYTTGKSICLGDYGGPILVNGVQVGISSYVKVFNGKPACERGAVFTRVSTYVNNGWIVENMLNGEEINPIVVPTEPTTTTKAP
ncbi:chymotrypsin-2-like [Daphnia carinata]|uniref:chymotrypsin-2-like n=1 Tax=Daphnia carinata TaxID=120202 RepID=UPI00257FCBF0|nr:chymotrypsin-2-like [Daphnia carinata]